MKYKHLSIDIETLDTVPGGLICSLGAVPFGLNGVPDSPDAMFLHRVSIVDGLCLGLTVCPDTLAWWRCQSEAARVALESGASVLTVAGLFERLTIFVEQHCDSHKVQVWTKGPAFDSAFLSVAARKVDATLPWRHWNDRCVRTICEGVTPPASVGVAHNALDDAIYQARWVRKALTQKKLNPKT